MVKEMACSSKVITDRGASCIEFHIYSPPCHMIYTTSDWLIRLKCSVDEHVQNALITWPWGYVEITFCELI
jgi:hypothetical protein